MTATETHVHMIIIMAPPLFFQPSFPSSMRTFPTFLEFINFPILPNADILSYQKNRRWTYLRDYFQSPWHFSRAQAGQSADETSVIRELLNGQWCLHTKMLWGFVTMRQDASWKGNSKFSRMKNIYASYMSAILLMRKVDKTVFIHLNNGQPRWLDTKHALV